MAKQEFDAWKDDRYFMNAEAVRILPQEELLAVKVFWLNPPGVRSERMSFDVSLLSEDKRTIEHSNMVVGWKCRQCNAVLFGTRIKDLLHLPCCVRWYDGS